MIGFKGGVSVTGKRIIYKIENLISGKVYIGQTGNEPHRRWQTHRSRLKRNVHDNVYLQSAWNEYGEGNFAFSVVTKCSADESDAIERATIKKYTERSLCYNLEDGGCAGKQLHESTRAKLSASIKEKWQLAPETYGVCKPVVCIDTGITYPSVAEAAREVAIPYTNVQAACSGKILSTQGKDGHYYQFAFYEDGKKYKLKKAGRVLKPKRVVCINTGETYNSTGEAAKKTGAGQGHISSCCNGRRQFAGIMENGDLMKWAFESDYDPNSEHCFRKTVSEETRKRMSESHGRRRLRLNA